MAHIEGAADLDHALLEYTIESTRADDPELADALRYCAIPRNVDSEILQVHRGGAHYPASVDALMKKLASCGFVLPREGGDLVYHDMARTALLADWLAEGNRPRFEILTRRLVDLWEKRQRAA